MPTYEYECTACGHRFEIFQSMTEKPKRKCPSCLRLKARRLIGAGAGIIFRGSGFYCTDYRSNDYKNRADKVDAGNPHKAGSETACSVKKSDGKKPENKASKKSRAS